jgi:hypothetical protein
VRAGSRRISPSCQSFCASRNQISGIVVQPDAHDIVGEMAADPKSARRNAVHSKGEHADQQRIRSFGGDAVFYAHQPHTRPMAEMVSRQRANRQGS